MNDPDEFAKFKKNFLSIDSAYKYVVKYMESIGETIDKKYRYLCRDCANMLKCPKVKDSDKKALNKYPFIKNGLEVIYVDVDKRKEYLSALKKQRKMIEDGSFDEKDQNLNSLLASTGIDVPLIGVFKCSNFVDEIAPKKENKQKKVKKKDDYITEFERLIERMGK